MVTPNRALHSAFALAVSSLALACGGSDDEGATADPAGGGGGGGAGTSSGAGAGGEAPAEPQPEPCPGGGLAAGDHLIDLSHGGTDYVENRVHVPPGYDGTARTPLVVNWHGLTSNAAQQELFSGFNTQSDGSGMIVVYPNSPTNSWDGGACCNNGARDDVGFVRALVAELQSQLCIDPRRIYSTGMSNGGFMTHRLACEAADLFAAFAPVAAVMGLDSCTPSRPVPLMHFHGTEDGLVNYQGTPTGFIGVAESTAGWVERNGCTAGPEETLRTGAAHCDRYSQCNDGVEVVLCTVDGMGHCWPGTAGCPFGAANTDIDASAMMVPFFESYPLP